MIEIKDLSYTIGKKEILKNISFTVNKGSMTCIVGPNGCGNPLCSPTFPAAFLPEIPFTTRAVR